MGNVWIAGTKIRITNSPGFQDNLGNLIDPATVQLVLGLGLPAQAYNPGNIVRDSIGVYHYDLDTTGLSGTLVYEWKAPAGAGQAIQPNSCEIKPAPL